MKKIFTTLSIFLSSVAMGQTPCDSLDINVSYYPFSDSLLQVHVINNSSGWYFNYPQFTILDTNADTVAHEQVNFFGIGQESLHSPEVYPGMPPANTFNGPLLLYYVTVDSYAVCTWNMNFDLCPDSCTMFFPHFGNSGSQTVTGSASWEVIDIGSQVVASGTFTLDSNTQYVTDSACLSAGDYTLKVTDINLSLGGQKTTGISSNWYVAGPQVAFNDPVENIQLNLYEACQQTTKVKAPIKNEQSVSIYSYEDNIHISSLTGKAIGEVRICSVDGRTVRKEKIGKQQHIINMASYSYGVYIVKVVSEGNSIVKKVFVGK